MEHSTICRQFFESEMWAFILQNFIPLLRHVEDFEVEDKASDLRLQKVKEEGLYQNVHLNSKVEQKHILFHLTFLPK